MLTSIHASSLALWSFAQVESVLSHHARFSLPKNSPGFAGDWTLRHVMILLDLGWAVMDAATVQSCACILDMRRPLSRFIAADRKEASDKTQPVKLDGNGECAYLVARSEMLTLPQSRVVYSLPPSIVSLLKTDEKTGTAVFSAKLGMKTFNDFRFLRLRYEVSPDLIGESTEWEPLSKGGPYGSSMLVYL